MTGWKVDGLRVERSGFRLGPVSFSLEAGEAVALVGPNGSGKTTLVRAIAGLEPVRAGAVWRGNEEVTAEPPERRGLGYIPPGGALFPHRTVRANVAYPALVRGDPDALPGADRLLERFGLAALASRFPRALSSGEQQRVAVARALAARPDLLLWDEPVAAMDLAARRSLHETLRVLRERERVPLVFVTHEPSDAFGIADRFVRLEAGRVLRSGPMASFGAAPSSEFDARFLGYANVLGRRALDAAGSAFGRWLRERSGSGGVAFSARAVRIGPDGSFEGTVRRVEPHADVRELRLAVPEAELVAELPGPAGGEELLRSGASVRFGLSESALWRLEAVEAGGAP